MKITLLGTEERESLTFSMFYCKNLLIKKGGAGGNQQMK